MNIFIKVLDVKDGDAVIVHLQKDQKELIFLIDAGRERNSTFVISELNDILKTTGKKSPDFILCTHFDDDHIGGLAQVIKSYAQHKPPVWMHKTSEQIDIEKFKRELKVARRQQNEGIFPSEASTYLGGGLGIDHQYYAEAIRTVEQEQDLIKLMNDLGIECREPLVENFDIEGWPELTIVSPTSKLYQQLFPDKFIAEKLIESTVQQLKNDESDQSNKDIDFLDPFEALDNIKKSNITPTNMNSAMLMLTVGEKRFLFAADAGIQAISNIAKQTVENLYWLKVPHHGSKNNITADQIKMLKPVKSVISGDRLISPEVVACLEATGSIVFTTKINGSIVFHEML